MNNYNQSKKSIIFALLEIIRVWLSRFHSNSKVKEKKTTTGWNMCSCSVYCILMAWLVFVFKKSVTQVMCENAQSFLEANQANKCFLRVSTHYFVMEQVSVKCRVVSLFLRFFAIFHTNLHI